MAEMLPYLHYRTHIQEERIIMYLYYIDISNNKRDYIRKQQTTKYVTFNSIRFNLHTI